MNTRRITLLVLALGVIVTTALWVGSGAERLTKSAKPVTIEQKDDLFGDTDSHVEMRPGPIFGHYVGLDAVLIAAGAAGVLGLITILLTRRRTEPTRSSHVP